MATIFEDDFNSYNDGDLNGQGGWSGDKSFDIQGTTTKEGAKAVQNADTGGSYIVVAKTGTAQSDGRISIYLRRSSQITAHGLMTRIELFSGTTQCIVVGLGYDSGSGKYLVGYYAGGWQWTNVSWSANTWHNIEIEWRSSDHQARFRVDGGPWTDWVVANNTSWTTLDIVKLAVQYQTGGASYFDYIAEYPYTLLVGRSFGYIFSKIYEHTKDLASRIFRIPPLVNPNNLAPG